MPTRAEPSLWRALGTGFTRAFRVPGAILVAFLFQGAAALSWAMALFAGAVVVGELGRQLAFSTVFLFGVALSVSLLGAGLRFLGRCAVARVLRGGTRSVLDAIAIGMAQGLRLAPLLFVAALAVALLQWLLVGVCIVAGVGILSGGGAPWMFGVLVAGSVTLVVALHALGRSIVVAAIVRLSGGAGSGTEALVQGWSLFLKRMGAMVAIAVLLGIVASIAESSTGSFRMALELVGSEYLLRASLIGMVVVSAIGTLVSAVTGTVEMGAVMALDSIAPMVVPPRSPGPVIVRTTVVEPTVFRTTVVEPGPMPESTPEPVSAPRVPGGPPRH